MSGVLCRANGTFWACAGGVMIRFRCVHFWVHGNRASSGSQYAVQDAEAAECGGAYVRYLCGFYPG